MTAPVPCRQCGAPVEHDREEWATPVCYTCLSPIKGDLRGPVEVLAGPSPHPEGSSAEPAVAVPGAHIIDLGALLVGHK